MFIEGSWREDDPRIVTIVRELDGVSGYNSGTANLHDGFAANTNSGEPHHAMWNHDLRRQSGY